MSLIANRYARALYEAAAGKQAVDAILGDLAALEAALDNTGLRAQIMDPDLPAQQRAELLRKQVAGGHQLTRNLIDVLFQRRRWQILDGLPPAFQALVRKLRDEEIGVVETPHPLDEEQIAQLEGRAGQLSGKQVTLEQVINPELLGGVRLRVGNTLYDSSVATALEELERQLLAVPIH